MTDFNKLTPEVRAMLEAACKHIRDEDFDLGDVYCHLKDHYPQLGLVKPHLMSKNEWNNVVHEHVCRNFLRDTIKMNKEQRRKIKRYEEAAIAKQEENEEQRRKIKRYEEAAKVSVKVRNKRPGVTYVTRNNLKKW